jgi:maltose alpha-D-glucosyltransferase / alpha-amylase
MATDWNDPTWYKDAVIYQLHVKAFFDSDNDGMGDFTGLMQKLDYVAELGCTAIWLMPFYPSPLRDDGYDIADYRSINPSYGSMRDFRRFVREAHRRDIRVITELVINHTSDQHAWFQRARQAKPGSAARNYYVWSDTDQKYQGTRIIFLDTEKSNWTWDPAAQSYFWHRFYSHQPDLNFDNPAVFRDIVSVLHYWMAMGVDGMRLDAVPYLCEREGTNNENLPETHEVLKRIRAEVDARYSGRMLLAEANQWPEDTRPYFGDGDECHMSFHFPLMPRMYMALAQEDRHPITDIIRQTPDIPENCQWAIFLRNHDELTLEMVTDRERDYLWETYATDRRMRINLGIRRRLAPLLDNDRRKIELMNAMLFSMPGTPVIYYGDEIGMGDNFYLGDRDGVCTPMQWSPDRNGGFSRTDPQRLYLPPIMDPIYGYEVVNVESQVSDRSSLLNWMIRLLTVRKQRPAFGRGTMTFVYPRNRKILAYLRDYEDDTILAVFNLSRAAQAVELDLSAFKGRVPIELLGRSPFPPIGDLPYMLTLPAYGFYWFVLAKEAELPTWHEPVPEALPEFATIVIRDGWPGELSERARQTLEQDVLPAYLRNQRWFAAKDARRLDTTISWAVQLEPGDGSAGEGFLLTEVTVTPDGASELHRYFLPLDYVWGEQHIGFGSPYLSYTLAKIRRGPRIGIVYDAAQGDTLAQAIVQNMRARRAIDSDGARLTFLGSEGLDQLPIPETPSVRRIGVEQSNTSMIVNEQLVLKLYRRLQSGVQPEVEMARFLTEVAGFANTPAYLGSLQRLDESGEETALGIAFGLVPNQGDGWNYTVDWLRRFMEEQAIERAGEHDEAGVLFTEYAGLAETLGTRTAELHRALAAETDDPAFAGEPIGADDLASWGHAVHEQHALARTALRRALGDIDEPHRARAEAVLAGERLIAARIDELTSHPVDALKTRIHGDYHLGQVLVSHNDFFIIDFEGEPARSFEQRRQKLSPLKDVAGMIRSFDYAAYQACRWALEQPLPNAAAAVTAAESWGRLVQDIFLTAYIAAIDGAPSWPGDDEARGLLDLFLLEKALYEIVYEATNRPRWLEVPLSGLARLLSMEMPNGETTHES